MRAPTVLIAEDDSALVQVLAKRCRKLGLTVLHASDAMHALLGAHRHQPDLVVLDAKLPGGEGAWICELLASTEALRDTPIILMTAEGSDDAQQSAKLFGAHFVCKGPQLWHDLRQKIGVLLELPDSPDISEDELSELEAARQDAPALIETPASNAPQNSFDADASRNRPSVLVIDDDPDVGRILKVRLEWGNVDVLLASNGMRGFWAAVESQPDVIICDLNMPDGQGDYVNGRLKSHAATRDIPVIILTGQANPAIEREMLGLGVVGFLHKPLVLADLVKLLKDFIPISDTCVAS